MGNMKREIENLKQDLEENTSQKNIEIEISSDVKNNVINLKTEINLLKSENQRLSLDAESKSKQIHHLNTDRDSLTKLLETNKKGWDNNDRRVSDLVKENHTLIDSNFRLEAEIRKLAEEKRNIQDEIDNLNFKIDEKQMKIKTLEVQMNHQTDGQISHIQLTSEIDELNTKLRVKNNEISELKSFLIKVELESTSAREKVISLLNDKKLLEQEIKGMQTEFTGICEKLNELEDKDLQARNFKEQISILNRTLEEKSRENANAHSNHSTLKLD